MGTKAYSYIRFSTPEQLKGSSLERQLEASRQYARDHGLDLDESMQDLGLSGFHGIHRTRGALGEFLKLIDAGKISKGSYLIVENLDRLSRQDVLTALNLFTSIIDAGITLVTLQDSMEYSRESIKDNWAQLIISITYMARAHDESLRKSQRGKSNWVIKRKKAVDGERKLTARCPAWLKLSEDRKSFIQDKAACHAIELIFIKKLSGMGNEKIARELNKMPDIWKPPFNPKRKSPDWRSSYISKILTNREVIGEFIPCYKVDDKRIPELPIADYFPHAVSDELFYKVQNHIRLNRQMKGQAGGQTGLMKNLFKHVVLCGYCGSPMHFLDKGPKPKGGEYLKCDAANRKSPTINCDAKAVPYKEFENLFFEHFEEECNKILMKILPNEDQRTIALNSLEDKIAENIGKINDLEKQITTLTLHISTQSSPKTREVYEKTNRKFIFEKESLEKQNIELSKEKELLEHQKDDIIYQISEIKDIYSLLDSIDNKDEQIEIRKKINNEIKKMFLWIKIYPLKKDYHPELVEIEPGIVEDMNSKYIDKVRFRLRDINKSGLILEKRYIDIGDESLESLLDVNNK